MEGLGDNVLLPSSLSFVVNVVMIVPALIYIDPWGRRRTALVGAFLMMVGLIVNGALFGKYGKTPERNQFSSDAESMLVTGASATAIIVCTYLFVASFASTWGPFSCESDVLGSKPS